MKPSECNNNNLQDFTFPVYLNNDQSVKMNIFRAFITVITVILYSIM